MHRRIEPIILSLLLIVLWVSLIYPAAQDNIIGTYIGTLTIPNARTGVGEPKEIQYRLEIRKDNVLFLSSLCEWEIKREESPPQPPRVIMSPIWHTASSGEKFALNPFKAYIEGETLKDIDTGETLTKAPGAQLIRRIRWAKPVISPKGSYHEMQESSLWSRYTVKGERGIIEFNEDETGFIGGYGRWEIKGDILTFTVVSPRETLSMKAKWSGNILRVNEIAGEKTTLEFIKQKTEKLIVTTKVDLVKREGYIGTYIYDYKEHPELSQLSYHHIYILEIKEDGSYRLTQGTITSDPKRQHLWTPQVQSGNWKIITKKELETEMRQLGMPREMVEAELRKAQEKILFSPPLPVKPAPIYGIDLFINRGSKLITTPSTVEFFPDTANIIFAKKTKEEIEKYRRLIESTRKVEEAEKPEFAGYVKKVKNLAFFLDSVYGEIYEEIIKGPEESCKDYEEEAAKLLVYYLLGEHSGKQLALQIITDLAITAVLRSAFIRYVEEELAKLTAKTVLEVIKDKVRQVANEQSFSLKKGKIEIEGLVTYLPYEPKVYKYIDQGEAIVVFRCSKPTSFQEIKEILRSGLLKVKKGSQIDRKLNQLPDNGNVRPFELIIRGKVSGTLYQKGEVWVETIKGPTVNFFERGEKIRDTKKVAKEEVEALIQALKDPNLDVRMKATNKLGQLRDPRAVEPLIAILLDTFWATEAKARGEKYRSQESQKEVSDEEKLLLLGAWIYSIQQAQKESAVRAEAAYALGKIKDPRAVEPLILVIKDDKYYKHYYEAIEAAIRALGEIGDPRAIEPLLSVIAEGKSSSAPAALKKFGAQAVKSLIAAFKAVVKEDGGDDLRRSEGRRRSKGQRFLEIIQGIEDLDAVEPLIEALNDEHWEIRETAVRTLGKLKATRAVEPLINALGDNHSFVRSDARWALNNITGKDFGYNQEKWKRYWRETIDPPKLVDSSFLLGKWVPEHGEKVLGNYVSTLEFKKDGTLISTMTTNGKWETKGTDQIVLSHGSQFFFGSPAIETYQINGNTLKDSLGNVLMKDKNAKVIMQTMRGRIWDGYVSDIEGMKREVKLKDYGNFLSTIYISERWEINGKVVKVYTLKGKEGPWFYEIKGEKIEAKLKDRPDMSFALFVRAPM